MISNIAFKGIVSPYKNNQGYYIIPISKNPQQQDIDKAIAITKKEIPHSGLNGRAYFLGEDLVVKKYKGRDEVFYYEPQREINALDLLFEKGITSKSMQRGEYAFTTPNDETYLVSTRVSGSNLNPLTNKFNTKNLNSLVQAISELDKPIKYSPDKLQNGPNILFPYQVAMHYDLCPGNFHITEDDAGIFDFEYLQFEDLNRPYSVMNYGNTVDTLSDLSDISGIVSNLRTFEYRSLLPYLTQLPTNEAQQVFLDYIKAKSNYHLNRVNYYQDEIENNKDFSKELENLRTKELAHYNCLSNPNHSILKAEAIKMQIAGFIYSQSPFSRSSDDKINPAQIRDYIESANKFFDSQISKSNEFERLYFEDCKALMNSWNNLPAWMSYQEKEPHISDFIPPGSNLSQKELQDRKNAFEGFKLTHELYKSKIVDSKILTLDEHLRLL